jgi:DEAD/DEAH box helicase domain-containing protein
MQKRPHGCRVPPSARRACQAAGLPYRDGVHAASHAVLNVLPLFMMCNVGDMRAECDNPYDTRYRPERVLIYDTHPGGIGLASQVCQDPLQYAPSA